MEKFLFSIAFLIFISVGNEIKAQTACEKFETAKQLQAIAGLNDDGTLKQVVLYWSKRCACESGAITGGTWDYTVEVANRAYDNVMNGGYTGPSNVKPDKKLTINDCNDNPNPYRGAIDISDCLPQTFDQSKDPQQFANAYMLARCECEKGVTTVERAKQLEATMIINFQNCKTYYGTTFNMEEPLSYDKCPIIKFTGGIQPDGIISDKTNSNASLVYTGHEDNYQQLKDEYLREFSSTETFNAYVAGENIKRTGIAIAKNYSNQLDQIGSQINSTNPVEILQEFNQKIQQIDQMDANFKQQYDQFSFNSGTQIGNSLNSKDYESAINQGFGVLNAYLDAKEAEKKAEAQRQELYQQRLEKMRQVYHKAVGYATNQQEQYYLMAAYAESKADENYYFEMAKNLDCFMASMKANFSSSNTAWLENRCPVPQKSNFVAMTNNFISEDASYMQVANRKMQLFNQYKKNYFREAAISFASKAINVNPKPEYFISIAKFYEGYSNVLELGNYLFAKAYGPQNIDDATEQRIDLLTKQVQNEVENVIKANDHQYLNTFLDLGLDDVIRIKNKSILEFAISLDQPDAVQIILNKKIENKNASSKEKILQSAIMNCAIQDSENTIKRLLELGIPIDFKMNGKHPLEVAEELLSVDAYVTLLDASSLTNQYKAQFANSKINILVTALTEPDKAAHNLSNLSNTKDFAALVEKLISDFDDKSTFIETVGKSDAAKNYLRTVKSARETANKKFLNELTKFYTESKSNLYFDYNLFGFNKSPQLKDFGCTDAIVFSFVSYLSTYSTLYTNNNTLKKSTFQAILKPEDNLALVAFNTRNPLLFKSLDKLYNLNEVLIEPETTLFSQMLQSNSFTAISEFNGYYNIRDFNGYYTSKSEYINVKTPEQYINEFKGFSVENKKILLNEFLSLLQYEKDRKYFYSQDFDFNKPINGQYPIFIFLNKFASSKKDGYSFVEIRTIIDEQKDIGMMELYEILTSYKLDYNQRSSEDGGTILHHLLDNQIFRLRETPETVLLFDEGFVNYLNIDKSIKDNSGQTAWTKFKNLRARYAKVYTIHSNGYQGTKYMDIKVYQLFSGSEPNETNMVKKILK